ncbi:MAG: tail fiber domain-containing protein [Flavobacteriales bacterium]|nr:MAG: tail fiber domain-containing protein [Flavobacteriales bacterium]
MEVRHDGNFPIDWYTNAIQRMRLNPSWTTTIGAFPPQDASGYLGLCPTGTIWNGNPGAFSRLHLSDGTTPQQGSHRPWMRNGIAFTGNRDHGYLGQKANGADNTDMVLHWSDNPGVAFKDRLRFIFTSAYMGVPSGAGSQEGLEAMRIFPARSDQAFVGIGDYYAGNLLSGGAITEPEERLEVLNRTIRLRRLIPDYNNDTITRVLVVDTTGRIHWRRISTFPVTTGGTGCTWGYNNGPGALNMYIASQFNPSGCPGDHNTVGIGAGANAEKLLVQHHDPVGSNITTAAKFDMQGTKPGAILRGVDAVVIGGSPGNHGVYSLAWNATGENACYFAHNRIKESTANLFNYGMKADIIVENGSTSAETYGAKLDVGTGDAATQLFGVRATLDAPYADTTVYAFYASVLHPGVQWAGWFNGRVFAQATYGLSDQAVKTGVADADVTAVSNALAALPVHTYAYNQEQFPELGLPGGQHTGVLAHEMEQLFPELVTNATVPAELDSTGGVVRPARSFKAVNLTGLVPHLVAGYQASSQRMQALEEQVAAQSAQLAQLAAQLAACCAAGPTDADQRSGAADERLSPAQERLLRIAPNPFADRTTLHCTLERAGRMQLLVNSSDGRDLRVLSEGQRAAGEFQYEWTTADLAPGVYYVTLLLDGEPLVKRAVKVGR